MGQRVAVLGNRNHGPAEARFIRTFTRSVTLIPIKDDVKDIPDDIGVTSPATNLALTDTGVSVTFATGGTATFDTLYVALGTTGRTTFARQLGVHLTAKGCIPTDAHQQTNIDGVYAIGDLTDALDQIGVAVGNGAIAATAIHNRLLQTSPAQKSAARHSPGSQTAVRETHRDAMGMGMGMADHVPGDRHTDSPARGTPIPANNSDR